jgi:hypothetical protein
MHSVTKNLDKILPNVKKKWPKIQNIKIKAEFESPKHTFDTLKYLQQTLC